jgi:Cu(I)/Ag(I) efflux system membrane fusion protein
MTSTFQRKALWITAAIAALGAVGVGAWWLGMAQGMAMMAAPQAVAQASANPSQWSIPQGEEATRRHIRDGIKAGDMDPLTGRAVLNYHDPMVPGKNFDAPAKSPFMDMMLVPRYAGSDAADNSSVTVSPRIQQNLGMRTAVVSQGTLTSEISAVGAVVWNERDQVLLQARATGFVEKLFVRAELDRVAKGAPVAEIYVPSWIAVQEEYLALTRMQGADLDPLREAARQRMQLAGMDTTQVNAVVSSGQLQARFTLRSPIAGTVTELMLREGATVMAGATLMRVQGTATVWAEGEVPESQAAWLKPGAAVTATSAMAPGEAIEGRVQALLPEVNTATRTIKARMELRNPSGRLVPGMLVQMRFPRAAAKDTRLVPSDAVIHTGRRSVVMLAEDGGRFRPVEVKTGQESGGQTEIVSGLQAGQAVVRSGNFLIDSEASLRGLESKLNQDIAATTSPATSAVYSTSAVIDELAGNTVTLTHPPIPALKWPQMQMGFSLPAPEQQPRSMAKGDKVQIEFRMQEGDVPQITRIEVVAPEPAK